MVVRSSFPASAPRITLCVWMIIGAVAATALPHRAASAIRQADEPALTLQARLCPDGYDDAAYAADCTEPLTDFLFDIAGPTNTEATTDEDGVADLGETPAGAYAIEALDFDPDDGFVVRCERPVAGGSLPVDLTYTDAGFDIDLEAELARELPESSDPANEVACSWFALPGAPTDEERSGTVEVTGRRCADSDEEPGILALSPRGDAADLATRLADCDPAAATVTLVNEETDDEVSVDAEAEEDPEAGFAAVAVPAGSYTAAQDGAEPGEAFTVDPGEATLVLVVTAAPTLDVSLRPGPTAVPEEPEPTAAPEPTTAPEPLATIEFGVGDWQDSFPNINTGVYDRAAVALYGALSPFPSASLRFDLPSAPETGATLTIEGLNDELGPAQITITVNGVEVFRGESGFAGWDPGAASPAWTAVSFPIPAGILQAGANEITVANLADSAAVGVPPYVLLSVATLAFEG